jgi:hypothetical protein
MFTRNNFDAGYVNGTLGTVTGFSPLGAPLVKTKNGTVTATEEQWEVMDGNKILARIVQIPLRLAWAITVHKSQGMSLDAAVIDLRQAFEFGQGYVAISRVRTLDGLFLEGFNDRALELHPRVAAADRHFRAYSTAAQTKFTALARTEKDKLENNFLRAIGAEDPDAVVIKKQITSMHIEGGGKLSELREKHANAYKKWTNEDDDVLEKMFRDKTADKKIAAHFGRQPSAIRGRLMHLELIPNPWAEKNRERAKKQKEKKAKR